MGQLQKALDDIVSLGAALTGTDVARLALVSDMPGGCRGKGRSWASDENLTRLRKPFQADSRGR